jgi:hypothetical protein
VQGARSYEVIVRSDTAEYRIFTDTTVSLPGTLLTFAGYMVFPPLSDVTILVSAVDTNYYDYYRTQTDPFAGVPPGHLAGALGVFGSVAPILLEPVRVRSHTGRRRRSHATGTQISVRSSSFGTSPGMLR